MEYSWPGNVRELENVLTRAAMYAQGTVILDSAVAPLLKEDRRKDISAGVNGNTERSAPVSSEKEKILRVLEETRWHYGHACKALGMSRPTLNKKMEQYKIPRKSEP
jgi:transcriptional regulator of acetoin/glycerol metabolism